MSDATTPANPTDQIAATRAIYRHDEDVRLVQSAILGLEWTEAKQAALDRIAAHIEPLEAERDALLAEHEAWRTWMEAENAVSRIPSDEEWLELAHLEEAHRTAHDNAERVRRGE